MLSRQEHMSDGTMTSLDLTIGYIKRSDISVLFDGVRTDEWAWVPGNNSIVFPSPVPQGVKVTLTRSTQKDKVINVFDKGASFTNRAMDTDFQQLLYLAQEYTEGAGVTDFYANLNMHGFNINRLADGVEPDDAVNLRQLQAVADANAGAAESRKLRAELAAQGGSRMVGFSHPGLLFRTVESKLQDMVSVLDFAGVDPTAQTDSTAGFQAALEWCNINRRTLFVPRGAYAISTVTVLDAVYTMTVHCDGAFFYGNTNMPTRGMFKFINCVAVNFTGSYAFHGADNALYESLVSTQARYGTSQSTTRINFYNPTFYNARCGIMNGDYDVDLQCSEINIFGANWFRCPMAVYNAGSNTGMQFVGCNLVSEHNSVLAAIGGLETVIHMEGGFVKVTGGSIVSNPTANYAIIFDPSGGTMYGPQHGSISVTGAHVEVNSGLIAVTNNRSMVGINSKYSSATFVGNTGFAGGLLDQDFIFIGANTWAGNMTTLGNNWYAAAQRSGWNISSASPLARIYTDKVSMQAGFKNWVGGVFGGQMVHETVPILAVYGLPTVFQNNVANAVKYSAKYTADELERYARYYDTATGVFTVPPGGFMQMDVSACIVGSAAATGDLYLLKRPAGAGAPAIVAFGQWFGSVGKLDVRLVGLISGDEISIVFAPHGADVTADAGVYNSLVISASTR